MSRDLKSRELTPSSWKLSSVLRAPPPPIALTGRPHVRAVPCPLHAVPAALGAGHPCLQGALAWGLGDAPEKDDSALLDL